MKLSGSNPTRRPTPVAARLIGWTARALGAPLLAVLVACGGGSGSAATPVAAAASAGARVSALAVSDTASAAQTVWTDCAAEGQTCAFTGQKQVRYGVPSNEVILTLSGGTACTNAVFGDPAYGSVKTCAVADVVPAPAFVPTDWTPCATEGGACTFDGSRLLRYGTPTQAVLQLRTGPVVACSNAVFGDPALGTVKSCWAAAPTSDATWTACAVENQRCAFSGTRAVRYGSPTAFVTASATNGVDCTNAVFGDPAYGVVKACSYSSVDRSGPVAIPARSRYVGTNLGGLAYWGTNFPFANLLKSGGGWAPRDDNGNPAAAFASTSPDGYPTALAAGQHAVASAAWVNTHYPAGQYTLLWDGDGTLSFPMSKLKIVSTAANRIVVEPTDLAAAMFVAIDATNPANPVRNVRFLWPGTEATHATQPFNPAYLAKIAPFSVLRFMDWGQTNGSSLAEWADRPLPTNSTYATSKGVPVEVMIDLANTLHVDPWFCIPHLASDDYIRQFATLLHQRLDPALHPHVEYSNELWNTGFAQTAWAVARSDALGLPHPYGQPSVFYARRSVQMFKLMQQVWGTADAPRLVRVLAGQSAWTQFLQSALADADTATNADVLAIAPYFNADSADNPANVAATLALTPSQVVDQMLASVRGNVKSQMTAHAALAAQYRLTLRAYESGPGDSTAYFPAANQAALTALFTATNNHPRMKDVYAEYYAQWRVAGGDTMNQYVDIGLWSPYGFWGALQYVTDDPAASPKYQGLLAFIAAHPTTASTTTPTK